MAWQAQSWLTFYKTLIAKLFVSRSTAINKRVSKHCKTLPTIKSFLQGSFSRQERHGWGLMY
jgi:hypothetical protein